MIAFLAAGCGRNVSITRDSVDSMGAEANGDSFSSSISRQGELVAFASDATNLVGQDTNGETDVFVHHRVTGATTRVSVSSAREQGNGMSWDASLSASGRYVAFVSAASNLVAEDTNGFNDVFVHDLETGTTTRVSVHSARNVANNFSGYAGCPSISASGRYVTFDSFASNLVDGDTTRNLDVFVHDRTTARTTRVSVGASGAEAEDNSLNSHPAISEEGGVRDLHFHCRQPCRGRHEPKDRCVRLAPSPMTGA